MRTVLRTTFLLALMAGGAAFAGSAAAQSYGAPSYGYAPSYQASSGYGPAYARSADVRYGDAPCETTSYPSRAGTYDTGRVTYGDEDGSRDYRYAQSYEAPRYGRVEQGWNSGYASQPSGYGYTAPAPRQAYAYGAYPSRGY